MEDVMIQFAITGLMTCAGVLAIIGIREIWFAVGERVCACIAWGKGAK